MERHRDVMVRAMVVAERFLAGPASFSLDESGDFGLSLVSFVLLRLLDTESTTLEVRVGSFPVVECVASLKSVVSCISLVTVEA